MHTNRHIWTNYIALRVTMINITSMHHHQENVDWNDATPQRSLDSLSINDFMLSESTRSTESHHSWLRSSRALETYKTSFRYSPKSILLWGQNLFPWKCSSRMKSTPTRQYPLLFDEGRWSEGKQTLNREKAIQLVNLQNADSSGRSADCKEYSS